MVIVPSPTLCRTETLALLAFATVRSPIGTEEGPLPTGLFASAPSCFTPVPGGNSGIDPWQGSRGVV